MDNFLPCTVVNFFIFLFYNDKNGELPSGYCSSFTSEPLREFETHLAYPLSYEISPLPVPIAGRQIGWATIVPPTVGGLGAICRTSLFIVITA
jgi:hypothetical protein